MLTSFQQFVDQQQNKSSWEVLPLAHTTLMKSFDNILSKLRISPQHCKIFDSDLLYFYYGKPNYRSNQYGTPTTSAVSLPICILFKNSILNSNKIEHIFPFDSGAFQNNIYDGFIEESANLDEYALLPTLSCVGKFLNYMFENFDEYYRGHPKDIPVPPIPVQISNLFNLYRATGRQKFDDRAKSIEISVSNHVDLSKDNIELIICPDKLRKILDEKFKDNITIEYYPTKDLCNPNDYYGVINHIFVKYLEEKFDSSTSTFYKEQKL